MFYLTYRIQIVMCKDMPCWLQCLCNECTTSVTWLQSLIISEYGVGMGNDIFMTTVRSLHLCWTTFVLIVIFVTGNIECDVNVAPSYTHSILVVCQL